MMTQPQPAEVVSTPAPVEPAPPSITVTPFSEAALAKALPKPKAAAAVEPAPAVPAAGVPALSVEPTVDERIKIAQAAADKIVARRRAKQSVISEATQRAQALSVENARLQQEAATARAAAERAERDPLAYMRERGLTDKVVAQAHVDDSTAEGRIAKLERELRARDERDAETQRTRAAQEQQATLAQREQHFVAHVQTLPDYPYLAAQAKIAPDLLVAQAHAVLRRQDAAEAARGVPQHLRKIPTNADVYDYLEWSYAQAEAARLAAIAPAVPPAPAPAPPAARKGSTPGTPGLSTKGTGSAIAPKSYGQMTKKERQAHDSAQFARIGVAKVGIDYGD